MVAIREGRYKFVHCEIDPPQLFDLESDPLERDNLAADPAHAALVAAFMEKVRARWDMAAFDAAVRESQARRWVVYPGAAQRRLLPVGVPAAAEGVGALHAQPHGPQHARRTKRFPKGE